MSVFKNNLTRYFHLHGVTLYRSALVILSCMPCDSSTKRNQNPAELEDLWHPGEGAVAAYVLGGVKAALEWVTVPVLALALCLPHGALIYWLSSSTFSIAQVWLATNPFPMAI